MQTSNSTQQASSPMLVACLCADWCGTCRDYQSKFEQLQTQFPGVQFMWVDVEDESELVDPIEVENFPTLLMATKERVQFFGTVMPHLETLQRLVEAQLAPGASAQPQEPLVEALAQRLWARAL